MSRPAPIADWVSIPELYADPFPTYERLRAEGGVHWVPAVGRYLVTSYDAVHATEVDQETFSADEEGSLMIRAMGHSMLRRDDPEHYVERRAWQPALRPGVVKRVWTGLFEQNARRYLQEFIDKGPGADLIADFAAPYTAENLRELLGLHNATQADLQRWSQTMIDATGNYADDPDVWAAGRRSYEEVDEALDEMLAWHAVNPNESLLSGLLRLPDYEMPLERIRANVKMTIGGGLNEPRDALGVATWALLSHPEQLAAVQADPGLWNAVFEETIRWVAPIGMYSRQTTREVELGSVTLPARAKLGICILSANRDETVWDRPEVFDVRREVKPHLAFGKGVHVCLGAWVARAEVADIALPLLFRRLPQLRLVPHDPARIGGWVFRGMLRLPVDWDPAGVVADAPQAPGATGAHGPTPSAGAPDAQSVGGAPGVDGPRPHLAIVGSGPAGCFTAQALLRAIPGARIDVFDRLPVPYGLVRYGVAADHQGTKSVARQFDRLFTQEKVRFHGGVRVDEEALSSLRADFDAVVLATGLSADRDLGLPGGGLAGVVGAGRVTRYLNGHPDEAELPSLGAQVAVVGMGNVAVDVVRLIVRDADGLDGSDVDDETRDALVGAVRTVHLIGRSDPGSARFDPVMVRELAAIPGVDHVVHGAHLDTVADGKDARWDAVKELAVHEGTPRVRVQWWFGATPTAIEGAGRAQRLRFDTGDGERSVDVDSVVTAIGFTADPATLAEPGAHSDGRVEPGLYVAGWLRTGPRGTIPDQRAQARALAGLVAADLAGATPPDRPDSWQPSLTGSDFDGWRRIDVLETLGAAPGRSRAKLRTLARLQEAAADSGIDLPPLPADLAGAQRAAGIPVTILFGTESGTAELVADDLRVHLAASDVEVVDLAETDPSGLDRERLHVFVCSTYGDGELPASARPFHDALTRGVHDLGGLRYAVFGLGDRSYTRTYSRGSELLDEALARCGARRVGEYGRHDAGGPEIAGELACDWIDGVLSEVEAKIGATVRSTG